MKVRNKVVVLAIVVFALIGCDGKLSNENRKDIENLKTEVAEVRKELADLKGLTEADNALAQEQSNTEIVFTPTVYQTEVDKNFRDLASRFDVLEVYPLSDNDLYRVTYTSTRSNTIVTKEIAIPLSFFSAVYDPENQHGQDIHTKMASRGYSVGFLRLFEQGEYLAEKKAILSLYKASFS